MKIIPLHSAEPTFLKLNRFEWGVSLFFALLIPLFLQSVLAIFGIITAWPLYIGLCLVASVDVVIIHAKSREQDFLVTWYYNRAIPDSIVGKHQMPFHISQPFTRSSNRENIHHENPFYHR